MWVCHRYEDIRLYVCTHAPSVFLQNKQRTCAFIFTLKKNVFKKTHTFIFLIQVLFGHIIRFIVIYNEAYVEHLNIKSQLGLGCSTNGPSTGKSEPVAALRQGQTLHFLLAHYGPRYQLHMTMWTFYVNRVKAVKRSLLPVASRWRHHDYNIQTHRSVQVGALM